MIIPSVKNKCGPPEGKNISLTEHRKEWLESLYRTPTIHGSIFGPHIGYR